MLKLFVVMINIAPFLCNTYNNGLNVIEIYVAANKACIGLLKVHFNRQANGKGCS